VAGAGEPCSAPGQAEEAEGEEQECSICFTGSSSSKVLKRMPCCSMYTHMECLGMWMSTCSKTFSEFLCPQCKREVGKAFLKGR
jgi:hypothetical protein